MLEIKVERKKIPLHIQKTTSVIILNRVGKKIYDSTILSRPMHKWVEASAKDYSPIVIDYDGKVDSKTLIKPYLKDSDYTLILYSTTPLLTKSVIENIIEFVTIKESVACKLPVGCMIQTKYLMTEKNIMFDSVYNFNVGDFYEVNTKDDITFVTSKMCKRINHFYLNHGVEIENDDTVYIEPTVRISAGVTIMSHTVLKGDTSIDRGSIIKENSVIIDSTIGKDCLVSNSNITSSHLFDNVCVGSFCDIVDATLKEDVVVGKYSSVVGRTIRKRTVIKERSTISKTKE